MQEHVQSSQPSRQSVNSVREIIRALTTSVDTTSKMTLQAIKLGARLIGSMKLEWTPAGGAPAGGIGNIFPSISEMDYRRHSRRKTEMEMKLKMASDREVGRNNAGKGQD